MATIGNRVTFEEFRSRCEDKSTITKQGQLYVGTSDYDAVNGKNIIKTVATPPPVANSLLVLDTSQEGGLGWKTVADVLLAAKNEPQSTTVLNADYANSASNVTSKINNHSISDIFESDGVTVKKSTDVSKTINGKNISTIFENDGTTAKNATNAVNATNAEKTSFSRDWTKVENKTGDGVSIFYSDLDNTTALYEIVFFDDSLGNYNQGLPYVHGFFYVDSEKLKNRGVYCCPLATTLYYGEEAKWSQIVSYVVRLTNNSTSSSFKIQIESRDYNTTLTSYLENIPFQFRSVT